MPDEDSGNLAPFQERCPHRHARGFILPCAARREIIEGQRRETGRGRMDVILPLRLPQPMTLTSFNSSGSKDNTPVYSSSNTIIF